jgi:hypothetical protein
MDINLFKESYGNYVREALGRNKNPDLSLCCTREPVPSGDTYLIPSWKMPDSSVEPATSRKASRDATKNAYSRDDFEKSSKTMADFVRLMTPHQKISEYYTVSNSQTIKGGHQFKKEKELVMGNDPTSRTVTAVSQMVFDERQKVFLEALQATSVQRKIGNTTESVSLPTSQTLKVKTAGEFSVKNDLPYVKAKFRKANVPDKTNIFALISTDDCAMFEELNFEKIYNTDYVQGDHLRSGSIPEMFGIKWMPTNLIEPGTMWFWLYDALAWVPYSPLEHEMGKSPVMDFDVFFKISESADCQRIDDLGVLKVDLTSVRE